MEDRCPRPRDGTVLCPAQLPGAPHALATNDLIGINSIDREEDEKVILAQGGDQGPFGEFEAESHGVAVKPRTQGGDPRVDSLGRVLKLEALSFCSASRLEASIMFGIRPVDPNKGRKGGV